jgi:hypothetical protein
MTVVTLARRACSLCLAGLFACGGADAASPNDVTGPLDAGTGTDAAQLTTTDEDSSIVADAGLQTDAGAAPYVPPVVVYPREASGTPFLLSMLGLYADMASKTPAPDLLPYTPTYVLWSDGAEKARWLRLPAGTAIDNRDSDHWQFPVGTVLFKEFSANGKKLETRVIARTGAGERDYFFGAFVWRDDESDAVLTWDGQSDVRGGEHDVPSVKQCGTCHNGEPGRVLGFSAVQLSSVPVPLQVVASSYRVPGSELESRALGYLHANCGHCHNPSGSARPDTDLTLRLSVAQQTVADTLPFRSTVGVRLQSFQSNDFALRVVAGDVAQSGLYFRMSQRGPRTQMPPIASEHTDEAGLRDVAAFIAALPH